MTLKIRPLDLGEHAIQMLHTIQMGSNIYGCSDADYFRDLDKKFRGIIKIGPPLPISEAVRKRNFPPPYFSVRCTPKGKRLISNFIAGINEP